MTPNELDWMILSREFTEEDGALVPGSAQTFGLGTYAQRRQVLRETVGRSLTASNPHWALWWGWY